MKIRLIWMAGIACHISAWLVASATAAEPNLADLLDPADAVHGRAAAPLRETTVGPPSTTSQPKVPVPAPTEVRRATDAINQIFGAEFAKANTPEKRVALAQQFLALAEQSTQVTDRWAFLDQAVRLAAEAGDPVTTFAAIDACAQTFDIDRNAAQTEAMATLVSKAPPSAIGDLVRACAGMCRTSIEQGTLAEARRLSAMTSALAKKSRNNDLVSESNQLTLAIREAEKVARVRDSLLSKHARNPTDSRINSEVAEFYCFTENDWETGLPYLAKGENERLAQIALRELAGPKSASAQLELADSWWMESEGQAAIAKAAIQSHAADLYAVGVKSLAGLEKLRVEKRIEAAIAARSAKSGSKAGKLQGLVLRLDAGELQSFEPALRLGGAATLVNTWRDLSGRGKHARQPDPTKQPRWSADAFDGRPGVVFSGSQTLAVPMPCGRAGTILVTLRPKATDNMRFLGCYRNPGEHVGLCLRSDGSVWAEAMMSGNATDVARSNASAYSADAKLLLGQSWDESLRLIGAGSVPVAPFTGGADVFPGPWGIGGAFLNQQAEYFNGVLGEVLVFDRELTAAELDSVWGELSAKWRCR